MKTAGQERPPRQQSSPCEPEQTKRGERQLTFIDRLCPHLWHDLGPRRVHGNLAGCDVRLSKANESTLFTEGRIRASSGRSTMESGGVLGIASAACAAVLSWVCEPETSSPCFVLR